MNRKARRDMDDANRNDNFASGDRIEQGAAMDGLLSPIRQERYADHVYDGLFRVIVTGKWNSGEKLPSELDLASSFNVSRPIVRLALAKLREDGLIISTKGSGSFVADFANARVLQVKPNEVFAELQQLIAEMEFRLPIEIEAAGLAAIRRSPRDIANIKDALDRFEEALAAGVTTWRFDFLFHSSVAQATGNPRFAAAIEPMLGTGHHKDLRNHIHFQPSNRGREVLQEHKDVFDLIVDQDAERARRSMRNHIERARNRLVQGQYPLEVPDP